MKHIVKKTALLMVLLLMFSLFGGIAAAAAPVTRQETGQSAAESSSLQQEKQADTARQTTAESVSRKVTQTDLENATYKEGEVLVTFRHTVTQRGADALLEAYDTASEGSTRVNGSINVVEVPKGEDVSGFVEKLSDDPAVLSVQPNFAYELADADFTPDNVTNDQWIARQWYLDAIGVYGAWKTVKGAGIKVAVLDTGVRVIDGKATHPDLVNKVVGAYGLTSNNTAVAPVSSMVDKSGHGTHVAGIIAAQGNNSIGISGVAPSASLLVFKVEDNDGEIWTNYAVYAVEKAVEKGAKVINMSFTGYGYDPALESAVNSAYYSGVTSVAAAGNDSTSQTAYPADFTNCISVTAVDEDLSPASYSNYGSKDIAAPGTGIYSTIPSTRYDYMDGTSMASPVVAATVALMQAARKSSSQAYLSPYEVKSILRNTALKATMDTPEYGAGVVDANAAVQRAKYGTSTSNTTLAAVYAQYDSGNVSYGSTLKNGDKTPYVAIQDPNVGTINLKAIAASEYSTVSGTGTKTLTMGENAFALTVRAQNGTTKTYNVTVYVGETVDELAALFVSKVNTYEDYALAPEFSSDRLNYSTTVPYTTDEVEIYAYSYGLYSNVTSVDITDTNPADKTTISGVKSLNVGNNTVRLVVTAQSGDFRTYTLSITREAPSGDNNLTSIQLKNAATNYPYKVSPAFNPATTGYSVSVPSGLTSLNIQAAKSNKYATVSGTGTKALVMGLNQFNIVVTAQNGSVKTYTLKVYRGDTDNNITSITAKNAATNYPYKLSPAFSAGVTRYTITVPYTVQRLNIQATAASSKATLTGTGDTEALAVGQNVLRVICKAQNSRSRTYFVTVNREAPSGDNNLTSIQLKNAATNYPYSVSPAFNSATTSYSVSVPSGLTRLNIQAAKSNKYASVSGTGTKDLARGVNQFTIVVTAQSGAVKTYTLTVTRG